MVMGGVDRVAMVVMCCSSGPQCGPLRGVLMRAMRCRGCPRPQLIVRVLALEMSIVYLVPSWLSVIIAPCRHGPAGECCWSR